MFHANLTDLHRFLRAGMMNLSMYKAGIALHFLQDMSVPLHTKKECLDWLKIGKHVLYETQAKHQQDFIRGLAPNTKESVNFYDDFISTYEKSSKMENPFTIKDKKLTEESVKEALHNAFDATTNYLQRLNEIVRNPDKNKCILDDFFTSEFIKSLR